MESAFCRDLYFRLSGMSRDPNMSQTDLLAVQVITFCYILQSSRSCHAQGIECHVQAYKLPGWSVYLETDYSWQGNGTSSETAIDLV
jgi:hypothetical protein